MFQIIKFNILSLKLLIIVWIEIMIQLISVIMLKLYIFELNWELSVQIIQ